MTAWLRAQVEADKAAAAAVFGFWRADAKGDLVDTSYAAYLAIGPSGNGIDVATRTHILLHDPRDVIADCDAKLRLPGLHQPVEGVGGDTECEACGPNNGSPPGLIAVIRDDDGFWPCATVQVLASGYRHRPGWREAWQEVREP